MYILAGIFGGIIGNGLLVTIMGIGAPLGAELVIVSVGAIAVGTTMVSRAISNMAGRVVEKGKGELMENCWKN